MGGLTHECPPFAIINPDDYKIEAGPLGQKKVLYGRKYQWGFCDAFSDDYSDFRRLYKLIISKNPKLTQFRYFMVPANRNNGQSHHALLYRTFG